MPSTPGGRSGREAILMTGVRGEESHGNGSKNSDQDLIWSHQYLPSMGNIMILLPLILALVISGCLKPGPAIIPQPDLHAHYEYKADSPLASGCSYTVSGYAENSGNATANRAMLYLLLVDTNSGRVRDSKTLILGIIRKGDSKTFETTLYGDCGHVYRVDASFGG